MSSKNDNSEMIGFAIVVAIIGIMGIVIYAVAAFIAIFFTGVAIAGWNRPITMFGQTLQPHEARAFVRNGVIGAFMLPLFAAFASALLGFQITEESWPHIFLVGYILGSIGVEMSKDDETPKRPQVYIPPENHLPAPRAPETPPALPEPFRFADWDDEDSDGETRK